MVFVSIQQCIIQQSNIFSYVFSILFANDFVTPEGLLSFQEICEIVGNSPNRILEYNAVYSLVSACSRKVDDTVATLEQPMFYSKKIRTARDLRQHLVNRKAPEPCAKGFWNRKFSVDVDKNFWSLAFRATKEARLRVLHWKILHNIYPTNILLCKMKVKENNKCTFWNELVDYIEHFFFECPVVRDFWRYIEQHIMINFNVQVHLTAIDILFGVKRFNVGKIKLKK